MRILHVRIGAFGGLRDLESGDAPLGDLVVVEGHNEAGKTRVFEFLHSMLYGIYPTSPDRHPFAPWDGSELGGSARIRLADGADVEVTRRLLSSPTGTLVRDGRSENLRNDDLPFVAHVPRRVFLQVHALGLAELVSLDDEGWAAVQDRILGRLGATDLRPAREVADELHEEARALWRPDRRGSPRIRRLDDAIREVSGRRPAARERSSARRQAAGRLADLRDVLASAREARRSDQTRLDRLRVLLPVRAELARIAELRCRAGDPDTLSGLPPDPPAELQRRRERVEAARRAVDEARRERDRVVAEAEALAPDDAGLVEREGEIEAFRGRVARGESGRARLAALEQELRSLERRIRDHEDHLPWRGEPDPEALARLPFAAFEDAWREWTEAWAAAERDDPDGGPAPPPPPPLAGTGRILLAVAVVFVLGAVLALGGLVPLGGTGTAVAAAAGAVTGLLGVWLLRVDRDARRRSAAFDDAATHERARRRGEADARRGRIDGLLADGGLAAGDRPDPQLPTRIDAYRQLRRDRDDRLAEAEALRVELGALDDEARALAPLVRGAPPAAAPGVAALLQDRLREARDRAGTARRASDRREAVEAALAEARDRLERAEAESTALEARLTPFDADDPVVAAGRAADALDAHRDAERRTTSLRAEHPDLDALHDALSAARRAGEAWVDESDPLATLQAEIDDRTNRIEGWVAEEQALEARVAIPDGEETLDDLEGELRRLRDERDRLRREHDRLRILAAVVDEADRLVRDLHQPDILRLAGEHLILLTGGRYDRLEVAGERAPALQVSGPAVSGAVEVGPPLSTGTREQIYVALRLALVDHLDQDAEPLPLFLDEILVNWDPARRRRGLDLLERTASRRQVFLFTCHPHVADEAVERGATRWRLEAP